MHLVVFKFLPPTFQKELRHQQRPDRLAFAKMRTRLPKCFLLVSDWFLLRFLCELRIQSLPLIAVVAVVACYSFVRSVAISIKSGEGWRAGLRVGHLRNCSWRYRLMFQLARMLNSCTL